MAFQIRRKSAGWCFPFEKLVLLAAVVGLFSACGPIQTIHYIQETKSQLDVAKSADAEVLAPFEYVSALAYLEKVREEHGYAEFATCVDFGQKALKYAKSANAKAMEAKADGALPVAASSLKSENHSAAETSENSSLISGVTADAAEDEPRLPDEKVPSASEASSSAAHPGK